MVELRHHQRLVWEGWFPEQAEGWWEEWMRQADQVLDDDELLEVVYEAQGKRRPKSHCRWAEANAGRGAAAFSGVEACAELEL
jgi:hypothetical protein